MSTTATANAPTATAAATATATATADPTDPVAGGGAVWPLFALTDEELARAKGSLRGGLVLGLEDAQSRMHRIGRSEVNYQNQRTVARTLTAIEKVSAADVNRVARDLLSQPFGGAVLGPHRGKRGVPSPVRNWLG